jgi:hypothetical protein
MMRAWRRRLSCGVAISLLSAGVLGADITIALDETTGEIEVNGLSAEVLGAGDARTLLRVSVDADAPPILGDYRVDGDVLRFRPMFPFDRGRDYVVRVDAGEDPIVTRVRLPAGDITPSTLVSEIYPTAQRLPENQLKFYVHFSAPMAGGDGLEFVKLLDESGAEVVDPFLPLGDAFWDRERRRYTIFFDPGRVKRGILPNEEMGRPILEGKRYTLVIDPEWRDAEGLPLAAPHEKAFIADAADERPIDPALWTLQTPKAGNREPLVVDFHEPLDHAVLIRSLRIDGIDGNAEVSVNESRWSWTPTEPWLAGAYELIALSVLEDLAGNQIGKAFEVDVFERIDSPDDVSETHRVPFTVRDEN